LPKITRNANAKPDVAPDGRKKAPIE
jgi:hypothetical protein